MFFLSFLWLVAKVLVLVCSTTPDIRYVRPADSPLSSCPGQPCLTLHEYVEIDNFTNGTTLQFLPGNHTLQQSFSLVNISNIIFEAVLNHPVTNIISKDNATIHCDRITHLDIVGLSFIISQRGNGSAIEFSRCNSVLLSDVAFKGRGEVTGRAIRVLDSEVTIDRCMFEGLIVTDNNDGGAICSIGTHLAIHWSSFFNNVADYRGGAIYANTSSFLLNKTIFNGNSAKCNGGAISCYAQSQVNMVGSIMFHNNSCKYYGGAINLMHSELNIAHGIACFHFNQAWFGGAISLQASNTCILCNASVTMMKNKAFAGGALYIGEDVLGATSIINATHLTLKENAARDEGGAIYTRTGIVILRDNVTITRNTAKRGGGMRAIETSIYVTGDCFLAWNNAAHGGAMNTLFGTVSLRGSTSSHTTQLMKMVGQCL